MTSIKQLNNMPYSEVQEICTLYALGVGIDNNGRISGIYAVRKGQ